MRFPTMLKKLPSVSLGDTTVKKANQIRAIVLDIRGTAYDNDNATYTPPVKFTIPRRCLFRMNNKPVVIICSLTKGVEHSLEKATGMLELDKNLLVNLQATNQRGYFFIDIDYIFQSSKVDPGFSSCSRMPAALT